MRDANEAFDLGVTALAKGEAATATAYLLDAHDLAPRDGEITAALAAAREATGSQLHGASPWPVAATELALVLVLVNLAVAAGIAFRASRRLLLAGGAFWVVLAGAWLARTVTHAEVVVVRRSEVITRVADDTASLERYRVHLGDEVRVTARRGDWLKVTGPEGAAYIEVADVVSSTQRQEPSHREE
jgi:hypothetical protein